MREIQFLKPKYKNPRPLLYKWFGELEMTLASKNDNKATDINVRCDINEPKELTLKVPFLEDRKLDKDSCQKLILFEDIWYIISDVDISDDDRSKTISITAKEYCDCLKGIPCEPICEIGESPKTIFNKIMNSTKTNCRKFKWKGTDVDSSIKRHLVTENENTVYQNLIDMAKVFDGWLEFSYDEDGQGYVFLRTKDIDEDKFIKKNLDMKQLRITYNSSDIFTRYYPTGATDEYGIVLDVQEADDNESGSAIMEDYSYYQNMGIPDNIIKSEFMYNRMKSIKDDTYTDANDLYEFAKQELKKSCVPIIDADIKMSDLSIYIDTPIVPPQIGLKLRCIDKNINFIFDCKITGFDRNYNNPADTTIRITNVIPYDTNCGNLSHTIDVVGTVTSSDPRDTDGNEVGDGEPYVKGESVLDGDHINVIRRVGDVQSNIYATNEQVGMRVDNLNKSFSEIQVNTDNINLHVEELGNSMTEIALTSSSITNTVRNLNANSEQMYTQFLMTADKIGTKVSKGEMGSMIEQYPTNVMASWTQNSRYLNFDDTEGLQLGDKETGSYSKIGYNGRLEMKIAGQSHPYHCLSYTGNREIHCTNSNYTTVSFSLPSLFNGIPDDEIKVMVSTQKVYKEGNEYIGHWSGAYGEVRNRQVILHGLATFRYPNYGYTEDGRRFVESFSSPQSGNIIVSYMIIA